MKERIGKFYMSLDLVVNKKKEVAETLSLMEFIPVRVELLYHRREFEYIGYSPLFKEKEEGSEAPEYLIEIREVKSGKTTALRAIEVKK